MEYRRILKKILDKLLDDWVAKLLCFGAALMSYGLYWSKTFKDVVLTVPVHIVEDDSMCIVGDRESFTANVTVHTTAEHSVSITDKSVVATADLSKYMATGTFDVPINISFSPELQDWADPVETKVRPEHIKVSIERTESLYIPIKPRLSGEVAQGYECDGYTVTPDTVLVTGPESMVENIKQVQTNKVDIHGAKANVSANVSLIGLGPNMVLEDAKSAIVTVNISPLKITKTWTRRNIEIKRLDKRFLVASILPRIDFELRGPELDLEALGSDPKIVRVDCSSVKAAGTYSLPVVIDKPLSVTVVSRSMDRVNITFTEVKPKETITEPPTMEKKEGEVVG